MAHLLKRLQGLFKIIYFFLRYADIMKTMYSIFCCVELIPIAAPIYLISLLIYYWIDKVI